MSAFSSVTKNRGENSSPASVAGRLAQAALLLEQQDAEAVEAGIAQRLPVFRDVGAEAARTAGAGGKEHARPDDLLDRHALAIAQVDQMLHEVADGEVRGIALRAVAEFLAVAQRLGVGDVERLHVVAEAGERRAHELIVRHRQPAEEDRRVRALGARERLRVGVDPVLDWMLVETKPLALGFFECLELGFDLVVLEDGGLRDRRHPLTS